MSYLHLGCPSLTFPTTSSSVILKQLVITASFPLCSTELQTKSTKSFFADFRSKYLNWVLSGALALGISLAVFPGRVEAKVAVNKPELLPKEFTTVIDVAEFLSDGQNLGVKGNKVNISQEKRLAQEMADIEKDTGFKLRVLAQNYPDTPGEGQLCDDPTYVAVT